MSKVKWVHSYQIGIAKASDEDVAMVALADLADVVKGLREFYTLFTGNHENAGLELYGRVNGKELTPTAQRLNELLDQTKDVLAQLAPEGA